MRLRRNQILWLVGCAIFQAKSNLWRQGTALTKLISEPRYNLLLICFSRFRRIAGRLLLNDRCFSHFGALGLGCEPNV